MGTIVCRAPRFWMPDARLTVITALFMATISTAAGCSGRFMRIPVRVIIKNNSFTDVGNWDEYGEYVSKIVSGSLYQTEMGKKIREELEKDTPEEFFRKYQFLTLSTCCSWVGRDARLLVISVRQSKDYINIGATQSEVEALQSYMELKSDMQTRIEREHYFGGTGTVSCY